MLKLLLAVCCLIAGFCGGIKLSSKYTDKFKFYKSFCRYNEYFFSELTYFRRGLSELNKYEYYSEDFVKILNSSGLKVTEDELPKYLSESQKKDITHYFNSLGKSDSATQTELYESYKTIIGQELITAEKEQAKYCSLCKKTGLLVGLTAFIILF